jgi:hypothetical protein
MATRVWLHNLVLLLYLFLSLSTSPLWMVAPWRQDGGQRRGEAVAAAAPRRCSWALPLLRRCLPRKKNREEGKGE